MWLFRFYRQVDEQGQHLLRAKVPHRLAGHSYGYIAKKRYG
jgi:hypothetical protein